MTATRSAATHNAVSVAAEGSAVATALVNQGASPVELTLGTIRWAAERFGDRLAVLSSMGDEVMVHIASEAVPGINVVFLDTGYHFAETLGTRDAFAATRPITLVNMLPKQTVAEQDAEFGAKLHDRDPDLCCAMRKVEPLNRALESYDAWISGMRREESATRADIDIVEYDAKRDKVKLNPFATWTQADLDEYAVANGVLQNPLRQLGYTSIGCAPCTRAVAPGEDPRSGRWANNAKTECGIHT